MAARKLQQEVDKCFKKVAEGVAEFEGIYEKIEQSNNLAQKEKLEDNLKREIKKLQRLRDQIKTWAASNDIKDKTPLLDHRRLIETQMEKFKAVEKAMKTKAYSKEGLSAAAKLDPKEQAKMEMSEFLGDTIDLLEQQIEQLEVEAEQIQASAKKGKVRGAQAERIAQIEHIIERHKWHQGKLELVRRLLENGGVDAKQVDDIKDNIEFYMQEGMTDGFMEDDTVYDDLALDEEDEAAFGMGQDGDKGSSQDAQSVQEDATEDPRATTGPSPGASAPPAGAAIAGKPRTAAEAAIPTGRRPSTQMKSPLPTLATLHTPLLPTISNGPSSSVAGMKPASVPSRPAGESLKYASAAAAAAANDRSGVGIAPLPPPPGMPPVSVGMPPPLPAAQQAPGARTSTTNSPSIVSVLPAAAVASSSTPAPQPQPPSAPIQAAPPPSIPAAKTEKPQSSRSAGKAPAAASSAAEAPNASRTNGVANGVKSKGKQQQQAQQVPPQPLQQQERVPEAEEESIYHLPSSLRDLVESFETTKKRPQQPNSLSTLRSLQQSQATQPDLADSDTPPWYQPEARYHTASDYPQEPLPIFNDPRLYSRLDTDTLFYIFYYKQGTYQQFLAAKALKDQSWRFHKQYQTWFQRHEEPKNITEEFEQGTYRFFDYESTWMNRRKADFKFAYKFLEDDV